MQLSTFATLSGGKRTWRGQPISVAIDPLRKSATAKDISGRPVEMNAPRCRLHRLDVDGLWLPPVFCRVATQTLALLSGP